MALRFSLVVIFLALALAIVADSSIISDTHLGLTYFGADERGTGGLLASGKCNGLVGDCIDKDEEMMMDSEISRRILKGKGKHISYGALDKNNPPCKQRGKSYYGCGKAKKVNPYKRGCNAISHCERYLK